MKQDGSDLEIRIREVLRQHARLGRDVASIQSDGDLYQLGLTSHACVNMMLALDGEFDIEFPDRTFRRYVIASVASIRSVLRELTQEWA